jgi:uncharacterized protein YidB (DUF937 family)
MSGFDDMIRSAAPGGNIGKPLMLALGALLASGALFRSSGAGQTASVPTQPTSDDGGVLGGLGSLLNKLEQGGLGDVTKSLLTQEAALTTCLSQVGTGLLLQLHQG